MSKSSIEWTELTWNPTTGCNKISSGCKFCYAEVMTRRLKAMGVEKYKEGFNIATHENQLYIPYSWKKPKMVFVNSMSDLFHPKVPLSFIKKVFQVMNDNQQHIFQVLTKRSERLLKLNEELKYTDNIWIGVSVEDEKVLSRVCDLQKVNAKTRFLSCEPLIGPLPNLDLGGIKWVIVGGESGYRPRPMKKEWVEDIQEKCVKSKTSFFFKQWGGFNKKKNGRELNGKTYDEMPPFPKSYIKSIA